jgi:Fe2+ transport system protein FeoA
VLTFAAEVIVMSLYSAEKNNCYRVTAVPDVGLLKNLGLGVGTQVVVSQRYSWGGPVLLNVNDAFFVAVGKDIATEILVA